MHDLMLLNERILLNQPSIESDEGKTYSYKKKQTLEESGTTIARFGDKPHLVSSLTVDNFHKPTLDIDIPCKLEPSSSPGKFHLFIDKKLTDEQYNKLLSVLHEVGIIEDGIYEHQFKKTGATMVRLPGVKKNGIAKPGTWVPDEYNIGISTEMGQ